MIIAENLENTKSKGKRYKNIKVNKPQFPDLQITTMNIFNHCSHFRLFSSGLLSLLVFSIENAFVL